MDIDKYKVLSFDCYGTLIDWESGILTVLREVLDSHDINIEDRKILELYAEIEKLAEEGKFVKYREVLGIVILEFGKRLGFVPPASGIDCLANSLKDWGPFPDTVEALQILKKTFKLAIISNIDRVPSFFRKIES